MMATVAYFAHKNGWGGDIKFDSRWPKAALIEVAGRRAWPLGGLGAVPGRPARSQLVAIGAGLVLLFAPTGTSSSQAVLPIMTPVLLIGGMTTGWFTPTEGAIAAAPGPVPGPGAVPHDELEDVRQGLPGHGGDHRHGAVHRGRGVDLRLAADRHRRHRRHRRMGAGLHPGTWVFLLLANLLMLFVGCFLEPTAAITILVPILLPIAPASSASTRCTSAW
jgi:TRAP-type C4-dicarboxylate transport system permease large subunit